MAKSLQKWMEDLPDKLTRLPINYLSIPGTHDSFTYSITRNSNISPDAGNLVIKLVKLFGKFAKNIIYNWAKTQKLSTSEQLENGIRYFDIRLAVNKYNDDIYSCHTLYGNPILEELREIYEFLLRNEKEVIILDFNHFYNFIRKQHIKFLKILEEVFGNLIVPFSLSVPSLSRLWESKQRVFIFYHLDDGEDDNSFTWPGYFIPSPWANTDQTNVLIEFLDRNYKKNNHHKNSFYVTQGILTPTFLTVIRHLFGNLENTLAKRVAPSYLDWLSDTSAGANKTNCVIIDFCDDTDFIDIIVNLNFKLL